jgi:hypothetical protein
MRLLKTDDAISEPVLGFDLRLQVMANTFCQYIQSLRNLVGDRTLSESSLMKMLKSPLEDFCIDHQLRMESSRKKSGLTKLDMVTAILKRYVSHILTMML